MKNAIAAFALVLTLFVSPAFAAQATAPADVPSGSSVFVSWLPMLGLLVAWFVFIRQLKKGGNTQDRTLAHMEKTERLLEEILEAVKRKA